MSDQRKKKLVKEIKVNLDKCIGCRACELACSGYHARPRYSSVNPARSRIRVVLDMLSDVYVPIRAGDYTQAECAGRNTYVINDKEYSECSFCNVVCPARDLFKEPDSGLPLKCDMCGDDPNLSEPLCVQVCRVGALTYGEKEVDEPAQEPTARDRVEESLEALVDMYGMSAVSEKFGKLYAGAKR